MYLHVISLNKMLSCGDRKSVYDKKNSWCQKADTYYTNKDLQSVLHEGWVEALAP